MKKIIIAITALLFSLSFAGSSFAALDACGTDTYTKIEVGCLAGGSNGKLEIKGSKSVKLAYKTVTDGLTYSLGTLHTQGNRQFASSSGDQKIFYLSFTDTITALAPVKLVAAPSGTAGATWTGASWSAM